MEDNRSKYHFVTLTVVALLTVILFGHGSLFVGGTRYATGRRIPRSSSVEAVQFTAASQFAAEKRLTLPGGLAQFPETVPGKSGVVPACSPAYLALLSIPAGWASALTPAPEDIKVSAALEAEKAGWERSYINYTRRYKLTVIFSQGPFLILLLLFFYIASQRFLPDPSARLWLTLGMCFGTLVYPFALTINPIFPAAVMLLCGMHYIWRFAEKAEIPDGVAAGLFIGAAIFINHLAYIPAVVMVVALAIKLREPERLLPVIGGLIPGLAIFIYSHITVFGDPLPAIYHRGGGLSGIVIIWKHLFWSLLGYNGAMWMAPATALALVYSLAAKKSGDNGGLILRRGAGIAACILLLVIVLEGVFTFQPLVDPTTGTRFEDAYSAARTSSPQLEVDFAGFPMIMVFHTLVFGGEALALFGPCLLLVFSGVFANPGRWASGGGVLLRIGIFIGIFAAHNPLGGRIFPLAENIHLLGFELAYRFPREAIF